MANKTENLAKNVSIEQFEKATAALEKFQEQYNSVFDCSRDYRGVPWYTYELFVRQASNEPGKAHVNIWHPFPTKLDEIRSYGPYDLKLFLPSKEDLSDFIACAKLANSYLTHNADVFANRMAKDPISCVIPMIRHNDDKRWIDPNTNQPIWLPLSVNGTNYIGFHSFHAANKQHNIQVSTYINDIGTFHTKYFKKYAQVNILFKNNVYSDGYRQYIYCYDNLLSLLKEEQKKTKNLKTSLSKKIADQQMIIDAFNAGISLTEAKEERQNKNKEKTLIAKGKRVGIKLEKLTTVLIKLSKLKSSIEDVERKALDEDFKFNFNYLNRRLEKIDIAIEEIQSFITIDK